MNLNGLRDPLANKKKNELIEDVIVSSFDYSDITNDDKLFLLGKEEELRKQAKIFRTTTLSIGKILFEANQRLSNYHKGKYMEWCAAMDISKDQSSYFLKRFNLYLEHKDKKDLIEKLPNQLIRALTGKRINDDLRNIALSKEIKNIREFNELKKEYSAVPNSLVKVAKSEMLVEKTRKELINEYESLAEHVGNLFKENYNQTMSADKNKIYKNLEKLKEIKKILSK